MYLHPWAHTHPGDDDVYEPELEAQIHGLGVSGSTRVHPHPTNRSKNVGQVTSGHQRRTRDRDSLVQYFSFFFFDSRIDVGTAPASWTQ